MKLKSIILVTLALVICMTQLAIAESYVIAGTGVNLIMSSDNGRFVDSIDLTWPSEDCYVYFETDGITYNMTVNPGYTVDEAYLYYGDGTGQFISASTNYTHAVEAHTDFVPTLCVIYTDSTTEELSVPRVFEAWVTDGAAINLPSATYSPPVTAELAINTMLNDNSDSPLSNNTPSPDCGGDKDDDLNCLCGTRDHKCGSSNIQMLVNECGKSHFSEAYHCGAHDAGKHKDWDCPK